MRERERERDSGSDLEREREKDRGIYKTQRYLGKEMRERDIDSERKI